MTLLALWRSGFLVSGVRGLVFKCEVVGRTERVGRARYRGSRLRQPSRAQLFLALAWRRRWLAARARFRCMAGLTAAAAENAAFLFSVDSMQV